MPFTFFALICQFQLIYSERTPIDQSVHVVPIDEQIDVRIGARGPDRPASLEKVEASDRRQDYDALSGRKRFYKASHQKVEAFRSTLRLSEASLQEWKNPIDVGTAKHVVPINIHWGIPERLKLLSTSRLLRALHGSNWPPRHPTRLKLLLMFFNNRFEFCNLFPIRLITIRLIGWKESGSNFVTVTNWYCSESS